jgi:hypothetical protein
MEGLRMRFQPPTEDCASFRVSILYRLLQSLVSHSWGHLSGVLHRIRPGYCRQRGSVQAHNHIAGPKLSKEAHPSRLAAVKHLGAHSTGTPTRLIEASQAIRTYHLLRNCLGHIDTAAQTGRAARPRSTNIASHCNSPRAGCYHFPPLG